MDRLIQLQAKGKKNLTPEERREYQRLSARKTRNKTKTKALLDPRISRFAEGAVTQEEFWQLCRADVNQAQLSAWLELQEEVHDQLYWMAHWLEQSPDDPDFVSLEGGLELLDDHVKRYGYIKDAFDYYSSVLNEFHPQWAIWASESSRDAAPYWKDPERLAALIRENEPTKVWALYGIRIGLPEYYVYVWKRELPRDYIGRFFDPRTKSWAAGNSGNYDAPKGTEGAKV